jgi:hypothetical protein
MAAINLWRSLSPGYAAVATLAMSLMLMLRACEWGISSPDALKASISMPGHGVCMIPSPLQMIWVAQNVALSCSISNQMPSYQDTVSLVPQ